MSVKGYIRKILFEAFEFNNDIKTYVPTDDISKTAKEALNIVYGKGTPPKNTNENEGNGESVVKDLVNKVPISHSQLARFIAFFENNKIDVESERNLGKNAKTSDKILIWQMHGGDECMNWANRELNSTRKSNSNTKSNMQKAGGAGEGKGMGIMGNKNIMNPLNTRTHGQNLANR